MAADTFVLHPAVTLSLSVTDLERGRAFYEAVLGVAFEPLPDQDGTLVAGLGRGANGLPIITVVLEQSSRPGVRPLLSFAVDDAETLDQIARAAEDAGGTATRRSEPSSSVVLARDADGNQTEILLLTDEVRARLAALGESEAG